MAIECHFTFFMTLSLRLSPSVLSITFYVSMRILLYYAPVRIASASVPYLSVSYRTFIVMIL